MESTSYEDRLREIALQEIELAAVTRAAMLAEVMADRLDEINRMAVEQSARSAVSRLGNPPMAKLRLVVSR